MWHRSLITHRQMNSGIQTRTVIDFSMADQLPLHGACSCGRNEYLIFTPLKVETLQVLRDDDAHRGKEVWF
jgi:transglutaminase-like putative cysteine protease